MKTAARMALLENTGGGWIGYVSKREHIRSPAIYAMVNGWQIPVPEIVHRYVFGSCPRLIHGHFGLFWHAKTAPGAR